jgi:NADH:ubiquinone oxidoreductase subunit 5 (subunit L)/multisubunit Na+/H+ antiporter MnhA subunit
LILGFGVKAGLVPLHVWLPLAHPAAPTAASAILSGAMIKAGLLGWLRVLPLGIQDIPSWGSALMVLGTVAMFGGALVGIFQSHPKVILAYSSISQMGMMTVMVGAGLAHPSLWEATSLVLLLFALHHGLAKGALFLAVGMAARRLAEAQPRYRTLFVVCMIAPACALAGVPGTSGALVKSAVKYAIPAGTLPVLDWVVYGMTWGAVGTSLLMIRYLWQVGARVEWSGEYSEGETKARGAFGHSPVTPSPIAQPPITRPALDAETAAAVEAGERAAGHPDSSEGVGAMRCGWILLVGASLSLVGVSFAPPFHQAARASWSGVGLWSSSWPWLLALLLALLAGWNGKAWARLLRWAPPAGDLLVPVSWLLRQARRSSYREDQSQFPTD